MENKCFNPDRDHQDGGAKCISPDALKKGRSEYILNSMAQGMETSKALKGAEINATDDEKGFKLTK